MARPADGFPDGRILTGAWPLLIAVTPFPNDRMPQLSKFINATIADLGRLSPELKASAIDAKIQENQDFRAANHLASRE
jgi:hypothetical protein